MSPFQQNHPHRELVYLFPAEEQNALAAFLDAFPDADDLARTNPPLAVALANARGWDTFGLITPDRAFVGGMLRHRRRRICGALGFPSSERVVRILGKVQSRACAVSALARVRCALRNPAILSIFSHLPTIGPAELRVAAEFAECSTLSFRLFSDLVTRSAIESDVTWVPLVRQIEILAEALYYEEWRTVRSVEQARRCYFDLWRELVDLEDPDLTLKDEIEKDIPFPPVPLSGMKDIEPIDSAAALIEEARAMKHCVLFYAEQVVAGDHYLYRVMHPERATVLIGYGSTGWHLQEIAGFDNHPVSSATEEQVDSWLRHAQATHIQ